MAARIVTYRRVEWAIDSFAPYRSPGMDGIFPALLHEVWSILVPYLVKIFRACLVTSYVPTTWRELMVVFIPEPVRNSNCGYMDFRPISITSFLLKTMEKLVDTFFKGRNFGFYAITSKSTCIPGWEICGNSPSSARGSGVEGARTAEDSAGRFLRHRRGVS
jgi:hypothetical protein